MKKQFFYAAFALAMMASCTSEDNLAVDPVNPTPDGESRAGISLGLASPTVNADFGRAMGSVGDVQGENNVWNGEKLYVAMYKKGTNTLATDEELIDASSNPTGIIMSPSTHDFYAPKKDKATDSDSIRIYQKNSTSIIDYLYYPVSGNYDFVGYHVDELDVTFDAANRMVKDITITGQQDIMGAITKAEPTQPTGLATDVFEDLKANWLYSARSARNKVHPTLEFKHQLARLKFFVRAGSDTTALYLKKNDTWVKRTAIDNNDETSTGAMYVTGISAKNLVNALEMNLAGTDANGNTAVTTDVATSATETATFDLLTRNADNGTMEQTLTPVAPMYPVSLKEAEATSTPQSPVYKETQVGESIMFFPYGASASKVSLDVELSQYVVDYVDESQNDTTWATKSYTASIDVFAKSIKQNGSNANKTIFEPGNSYNVYITVYSFERIVISAELTAWEDGGDIDVDVEEGASRFNVTTTFNVTADDEATITPTITLDGTQQNSIVTLNRAKFDYSIECSGYQTVSGQYTVGDVDATENIVLKKYYDAKITVTNPAQGATVIVNVDGNVINENNGEYIFPAVNGGHYAYEVTDGTTTKTGIINFDSTTPTTTVDLTPAP